MITGNDFFYYQATPKIDGATLTQVVVGIKLPNLSVPDGDGWAPFENQFGVYPCGKYVKHGMEHLSRYELGQLLGGN